MNGDVVTEAKAEETHPNSKQKWMVVNRQLLPVKIYYFLFLAAVGSLLPFISIYMKQLGLTSGETGIIYGVMPFIAFFVRPFFGAMADRLRKHTLVLLVMTFLTGILYLLLLVVPPKPKAPHTVPVRMNLMCNNYDSYIRDCQEYVSPNNECRLTMTQYKNLTFGDPILVEMDTNHSSYVTLNTAEEDEDVTCKARCQFSIPGAYGSRVCFMQDSDSYESQKCESFWISSTSDYHLEFTILNVSDILQQGEIKSDRLNLPHVHCMDYDLKYLKHKGVVFWKLHCEEEAELHCDLSCDKYVDNRCSKSQEQDTFGLTFWVFFVIYLIANIVFAPTFSLIDSIAYDILGKERNRWGFQRLFGTIGFALFAITSTFIMDSLKHEEINYSATFYLFGILCFLAAIDAKIIKVSSEITSSKFVKNIGKLLSHFHISAFLIVVMYFGMMTGAIEAFLFWYLLDLGSSQIVLGFCLVLNCTFEVIFLSVSGLILQKIGHVPCLYMAFAAYALRFFVYSMLTNPWYVLLIEPIHGINFGIMYAAASSYASIIAPPGMQATIQGLVGGLHFGFGKGIGSLVTGYLFEILGERWTFRCLSISAVVVLIIYILLNVLVFKQKTTLDEKTQSFPDRDETTEDGFSRAHDHLLDASQSANQDKPFDDSTNEKKA